MNSQMKSQTQAIAKIARRIPFAKCPSCDCQTLYRSYQYSLATPWDLYCWTCSWMSPSRKSIKERKNRNEKRNGS